MTNRHHIKTPPKRNRRRPLAAAALGLMLSTAMAPGAYAASKSDSDEVKLLRAQVQELSKRLETLENAEKAKAQSNAAAPIVKISAQQQTAPAQSAAASKPAKESWADKTSLSGRMYYNVSHITANSDGMRIAPSGTGFNIKRFYVGIDHKFNDMFSGNVTTDFQYKSQISSTEVYIKKAYLQAKFSDELVLRLGSTDLPWVPFVESVYNYRFVENTLIDRTKFGTSADWGVHASGKLAEGRLKYAVSVVNGSGYKAPLRSKGVDVEGRVSVEPIDHIILAAGGYIGKLGKNTQGATTFHTAKRYDALAAYVGPKYRIGAEYFWARDWNNVAMPIGDTSNGYSVFGSYQLTDKISTFGRYDWVKPNKDTAPTKKDNYFNFGVVYTPVDIVDFALVYKRDKVDNGMLSTSNGVIGGVTGGTYDEVGVFGRFRF